MDVDGDSVMDEDSDAPLLGTNARRNGRVLNENEAKLIDAVKRGDTRSVRDLLLQGE